MKIDAEVSNFLAAFLNDKAINVSVYKNQQFRKVLRKRALTDIQEIFVQLHNQQLKREADNTNFSLKAVINTKHPTTGLNILDYCIIAGLYDIALRVTLLGCEYTIKVNHLKKQLTECFNDEDITPQRVQEIQKTISKVKELRKGLMVERSESNWEYYKKSLSDYKYPLFLLIAGVSCIAGSPFSGGLSTILLLSIGIPSALASVSAFQSANNAQKNSDQIDQKNRIYYEAKELRDLLKLTQTMLNPRLSPATVERIEPAITTTMQENKPNKLLFLAETKPEENKPKKKSHWLAQALGY